MLDEKDSTFLDLNTSTRILNKLGLTQYQSSALAVVIHNPNCKADFISKQANIPITKVYSVLENLEDMNLIQASLERPKRYIAKPIDEIVDFLIKRQEDKLNLIKNEAIKAIQVFTKLRHSQSPSPSIDN
ncbi:MAG: helix-turn-helix domain-containing protein [archaeon]